MEMRRKKPNLTIAIMVDAFRHDYIIREVCPFLHNLKEKGRSTSLIPTFGFGPDAAYFAGLYPEECDGGMMYWYSPDTSPFRIAKFLPRWIDKLPSVFQVGVRKALRLFAQTKSKYPRITVHAPTMQIPFRCLPYFDFPMKYFPFEDQFVNGQTIFDILRENKMSWFCHGCQLRDVSAEHVIKRVKAELTTEIDFAFLHIGDLDPVGHKFGPNSTEVRKTLSRVDSSIEEIWNFLTGKFDKINLVIFGDHGMVEVKKTVDIQAELDKLNVKPEKDYIYFLDSTLARFWFKNEKAKTGISCMLSEIPDGKILSNEDVVKYRIDYGHKKFGELIFWVDGGALIFPNFFQNRIPEKGMHGYAEETKDNHSVLVLYSSEDKCDGLEFNELMNITEVFTILLKLVDRLEDDPLHWSV